MKIKRSIKYKALTAIIAICLMFFVLSFLSSESLSNSFKSTSFKLSQFGKLLTTQAIGAIGGVESEGRVQNPNTALEQIPLRLIRILPTTDVVEVGPGESGPVRLSGRTAITIIFNRAVIALGSDFGAYSANTTADLMKPEMQFLQMPFVFDGLPEEGIPGKFRWATTSIARFDPDIDWPSDLRFSVNVNERLVAFDGAELKVDRDMKVNYYTDSLKMSVAGVDSKSARNLTNELWSPFVGTSTPECPPDAVIQLSFNNPIEFDKIAHELKIVSTTNSHEVPINVTKCENKYQNNDQCVEIRLEGRADLQVDTIYNIVLPEGVRYHKYSGPLGSTLTAEISGLKSFIFPFISYVRPSHHNYQLWLRHGLAEDTNIDLFYESIRFNPPVEYRLNRTDKAILTITGDFDQQTQYVVTVSNNDDIKDGYGLPLRASNVEFLTNPFPAILKQPSPKITVFPAFESETGWKIITRGPREDQYHCPYVRFVNVKPSNLIEVLKMESYDRIADLEISVPHNQQLDVEQVDLDTLFGSTGLFAYEEECRSPFGFESYNYRYVNRAQYGATVIRYHPNKIRIWVTNFHDNSNVKGAEVAVYASRRIWMGSNMRHVVNSVAHGRTGDDGTALFTIPVDLHQLDGHIQDIFAVVRVGQSLTIVDTLHYYGFSQSTTDSIQSTMISDRELYKPGEPIYLKGYIRSYNFNEQEFYIPQFSNNTFQVKASFYKDREPEVVGFTQLDEFGAFNVTVYIPPDATYGYQTISIYDKANDRQIASTDYTIADPRIPAAVLEVNAKGDVCRLKEPCEFTINTQTYTGTPIGNAEVKLSWKILKEVRPFECSAAEMPTFMPRGVVSDANWLIIPPPEDCAPETNYTRAQGEVTLKTDREGKIKYVFHYPTEEDSKPIDGDRLELSVEYFGPTRETLTKEIERPIVYSDWKIVVRPTIEDPLPGYTFGVYVTLESYSGSKIEGKPILLRLFKYSDGTKFNRTENGDIIGLDTLPLITSETITSSDGSIPQSRITLPEADKYVLIASTTDDQGVNVMTAYPFGKNETEWKNNPLKDLSGISIITTKSTYEVGENATLRFFNPFEGAKVLALWGNRLQEAHQLQQSVPRGDTEISVPIGDDCIGTCNIQIVLHAPIQRKEIILPVQLPTSVLFDATIPRAIVRTHSVSVKDTRHELAIEITPDHEFVEPRGKTGVTLRLKMPDGERCDNGQAALWVVDKAIIDLKPSPKPTFFSVDLTQSFHASSGFDNIGSQEVYEKIFDIIYRRMSRDGWLDLMWPVRPDFWGRDYDKSDEEFFKDQVTQITQFPSRFDFRSPYQIGYGGGMGGSMPMYARNSLGFGGTAVATAALAAPPPAAPTPAPMMDGGMESQGEMVMVQEASHNMAPGAPPPTAPSAPFIRTDFVTTPVFNASIPIKTNGEAHIEFTMPDNIGTFVIKSSAVCEGNRFGYEESKIITRKELSLLASLPRIVRIGDRFKAGVTITMANPDFQGVVIVSASLPEENRTLSLIIDGTDSTTAQKQVNVTGVKPEEVRFDFIAKKFGDTKIVFTAYTPDQTLIDSFEQTLPVLAQQLPVFIATSFALDSNTTARQEGIQLPEAVDGYGNLTITAGVGRLTYILPMIDHLHSELLEYKKPYADTLLSFLMPSRVLKKYNVQNDLMSQSQTMFTKAIPELKRITHPVYGLQFTDIANLFMVDYNNYLNSMGLFISQKLIEEGIEIEESLVTTWRNALIQGLYDEVRFARRWGYNVSLETVAFARLVLGRDWVADPSYEPELSMTRLENGVNDMSLRGKAYLALIYIYDNDWQNELLRALIQYFESLLRVQGRTTYISREAGSQHRTDGITESLILNIFTKVSLFDNPLIEKVANGLPSASSSGYLIPLSGDSDLSMAFKMMALQEYDERKASLQPNLKVTVQSGSKVLMSEEFKSAGDPPKNVTWKWYEETIENKPIRFDIKGTGEASIVMGIDFIPNVTFSDPVYRGLFVQKMIRKIDPITRDATGDSITSAKPGETVLVQIQLTTPDDVQYVQVVDPLPGGLEAIDININPAFERGNLPIDRMDKWLYCFVDPFPFRETKKDSITFYSQLLPAGTYSIQYYANVVTSGTFVLPPTKAFVKEQPELMGLSKGGEFIVEN